MVDIVIIKGRNRASVNYASAKGSVFLACNIGESVINHITIPVELVEEFADDLKKIDPSLVVEVK